MKAAVYRTGDPGQETLEEQANAKQLADVAAFTAPLRAVLQRWPAPEAAGHRLVIGSRAWDTPRRLDAAALADLRAAAVNAPDHLPQAIAAIEAVSAIWPKAVQIGCSDSAFHRTLPPVARVLPLPASARALGLERFGYHGLSCEYVLGALRASDPAAAAGRVIIAHLGNGASLTAIRRGQSVETTMGFSPLGGLVMSTRAGDLDPGALVALLHAGKEDPDTLNQTLNHEAGLLGVSETTGDMERLLQLRLSDARAALAVDLFVYQGRKHLGALAAVLGGVETLVFTGGIGENSGYIRERISYGMEWAGVTPAALRVIPTDEDRMIARHTAAAMARSTP